MRTRRLAPLVIASLLVVSAASAKKKAAPAEGRDTVILNDGTVLKGTVVSDDPKKGVTIKLAGGKTRHVAATDVKLVDRAAPQAAPTETEEPEPTPAPKAVAPEKTEEPEAKDEEKPEETAKPSGTWKHEGVHFGAGLDLGAVLSSSNADNKLTLISPWLGAHGAIDAAIASSVYFRGELSVGTFSRKATVTVPLTVDTTQPAPVVTPQIIHNDTRTIDFGLRALVGYDYTESLTGRIGLAAGLTTTNNSAVQCQNDVHSKTGLSYGVDVVPIAARVLDSKALEVGLRFTWLSVAVPRCDVPGVNGFVAPGGAITTFVPSVTSQRIAASTLGLTATWMFW